MKRGWVIAIIVLVVLIVAGVVYLIAIEWGPAWVGIAGHSEPQMFDNQEYVPRKTLWDLLELLIVPAALALTALWFSNRERKDDRAAAEKRAQIERDIATDRLQEAALHTYYAKMSELLLEKNMREAEEGEEVISIARSMTLATLRSLDGIRKSMLIKFLYETRLINKGSAVVNLDKADLCKANLQSAILSGADLRRADLRGAELWLATLNGAILNGADLSEANLSSAWLSGVDLRGVDLKGANLEGADLSWVKLIGTYNLTKEQLSKVRTLYNTTMRDGTVYNPAVHTEIARLRKEAGLDDGNTPPVKLGT